MVVNTNAARQLNLKSFLPNKYAFALHTNLQVIWKTLYSTSSRDHGTLGHFCSLLGRLPRAKDPKKDFDACLDALFTVLKGHFVAAACCEMGITSPNDTPEALIAVQSGSPA